MTRQAKLALVMAATVGAALMLFLFDPARCAFYPVCLFHRITGLDCPGCGATRALHALLHGHVRDAFALNPLLVAGLPVLGLGVMFRERLLPLRSLWSGLIVAVVVAFWILRNSVH
jgi:hypothetical protein